MSTAGRVLGRHRVSATVAVVVLGVAVLGGAVVRHVTAPAQGLATGAPAAAGYFPTLPAGSWRSLPGDAACSRRVRRSVWEPRPDNFRPNHQMPPVRVVRAALHERPRAVNKAYAAQWDSWLLPRVTGHATGTTDEIIQWAACKWGLGDNLLRAIAVRESGWYQHEVYGDGTCVVRSGCGDLFTHADAATRRFCAATDGSGPRGRRVYPPGRCPKTFSIVGVMSWQDPAWGRMPDNQNGTFPFNRDSTAFALDYLGAFLRGCDEGWMSWLATTGDYRTGDLRGCVGVWYAGQWSGPTARSYVGRVWQTARERPWLRPSWVHSELPCSPQRGCPRGAG